MKTFLVRFIGGVCFLSLFLTVHCRQCSIYCLSCETASPKTCHECSNGYYPLESICEPCYGHCATCSSGSSCSSCKPGYYSPSSQCILKCPANCLKGVCADDTGYCTWCPAGRYGYSCDFDCTLCKNEQCDLRHCRDGCKDGYWEFITGNQTECRPCVANCSLCSSSQTCAACNDGTYLNKASESNSYCVQCPTGCKTCSDINNCSVCKTGYFGGACQWKCSDSIPGCSTCDWDGKSTITCTQCDSGWTLVDNTCVNEPPHQCPDNCESCSIDNVCEVCEAGYELGDVECISSLTTSTTATTPRPSISTVNTGSTETTVPSTTPENVVPECVTQSLQRQNEGFQTSTFVIGFVTGVGVIALIGVVWFLVRRKRLSELSNTTRQSEHFYENNVRPVESGLSQDTPELVNTNTRELTEEHDYDPVNVDRGTTSDNTVNNVNNEYTSLNVGQGEHIYKDLTAP